jgi:hypothetical protein
MDDEAPERCARLESGEQHEPLVPYDVRQIAEMPVHAVSLNRATVLLNTLSIPWCYEIRIRFRQHELGGAPDMKDILMEISVL